MATQEEERLAEQVALAMGPHAMRHSAALAFVGPGSVFGLGSATSIQVGSHSLLATAGHNFDDVPPDFELRIVPPNRGLDDALPVIRQNATKERGNSAKDLAWIEIAADVAAANGLLALPLENLKPFHGGHADFPYLVQGLPHTLSNVKEDAAARTLSLASVSYLTNAVVPKGESSIDITVDYSLGTRSESGPDFPMPDPHGISGGSIWLIANRKGNLVWSPSRCLLVGIVRGHLRQGRRLVGVQMQHWLEFVAQDIPDTGPEIREHLSASRNAA